MFSMMNTSLEKRELITSRYVISYMSHVTRKSVFGVCDQIRLKLACSASEASYSLEIWGFASIGIILSKQRTTKALVRLRGCADSSAPLDFAYRKCRFCHHMAHILCVVWFLCSSS